MIRIAFFDMGKNNFAQCVEDVSLSFLQDLKKQYKKTDQFLSELFTEACTQNLGVFDLTSDEKKLDHITRCNIIKHLNKYKKWWDSTNVIGIEQQFFTNQPFAKCRGQGGANISAIKIGEIVYAWFLLTYPEIQELSSLSNFDINKKYICYFGSQNKTQMLGCPSTIRKKDQRKKWAKEKAIEIFLLRNETKYADLLTMRKKRGDQVEKGKNKLRVNKKDDVSDCLISIQALKLRYFILKN